MSYTPSEIAALRTALGLTQDALAERLGVNRSNVSRWETGATQPRGSARKLLDVLAEQVPLANASKDGASVAVCPAKSPSTLSQAAAR